MSQLLRPVLSKHYYAHYTQESITSILQEWKHPQTPENI